MSLEQSLRHTLRRVEPETDMAAAVLARLAAPAPRSWRRMPHWALAASVVLAVGAGVFVQHERTQVRTEAASRQLAYALELTSRELENVHRHLYRTIEETGS
jgi:hypothetical protein